MPTSLMRTLLIAVAFSIGGTLHAQPTKAPTADEVKALQAKYRDEHDKIVKAGIAKRFLPAIMDKAEELAKKSDAALADGRLLQASEAIRQARWQLPYQPTGIPDHISRIIGNLRLRHRGEIKNVAFSPDGSKLASAATDGTVKIWDLGNGHEILSYEGHKSTVLGIAWTPDGKFIVSAGRDKNIKIWDSTSGKDEHSIPIAGEFVSSLALSRDGKYVFTGQAGLPVAQPNDKKNGLFVHDVKTGKFVRDVRDFNLKIDAIAVNHQGNIVAVGDDDGNMRLFAYPSFVENANQAAYWALQDATGAVYHLAFSPDDKTLVRTSKFSIKFFATPLPNAPFQPGAPFQQIDTDSKTLSHCAIFSKDGKTLFTGGHEGNVMRWDPATREKLGEYKSAHSGPVNALAFTPEGNRLASCAGDYMIRLWDFDITLQSRDLEGHDGAVWTAAFSPDATKILSASGDKTAKVWSRESGKPLFSLEHPAPVTVAQFSLDGKLIATAGGDKVVRIWNAADGKALRTGEGHQGTITYLDFSYDSKKIVSGGVDRRIKIWDADTGKELVSIDDNPSIVSTVAFSPDGKQVAVGNIDQTIRLYDAVTGKIQHTWTAHGTAVNGIAYSPNGQLLASGGADMAVQVWPLATPGQNSIRLVGHSGPVSSVAFRADNLHLVSSGADQTVKLWKLEGGAGKEVQTFKGHKDWVTSVAFSKDGYHVISASVDRRLKIWEITSRELPLLAEHSNMVLAVAVSPDGKYIATGSEDRTIKLWDRKTGVELATLTGHADAVAALVFTPDSKRIISSGYFGQTAEIRLWSVSPPRQIDRTKQQLVVFGQLLRYSPYLAIDPAGKTLFAWLPAGKGQAGTQVEAFDIELGTPLYDFKETGRKVNSLSICTNATIAATGGLDGSVRLWNLAKDKATVAPGGDWFLFDKVPVADLALSADGSILVATSAKGEVKIAKVQGRETLQTIQAHKTGGAACIISPDGKTFATLGSDDVVKAWSIDGKELRTWNLGGRSGQFVMNFTFSADGRQLVTANANTTVYVLDLP